MAAKNTDCELDAVEIDELADEGEETGDPTDEEASVGSLLVVDISFIRVGGFVVVADGSLMALVSILAPKSRSFNPVLDGILAGPILVITNLVPVGC